MTVQTIKRSYTAPQAMWMRLRPVAASPVRRVAEPTWKDRARAALTAPVAPDNVMASALRQPTAPVEDGERAIRPLRLRHRPDCQWWRVAREAFSTGAMA